MLVIFFARLSIWLRLESLPGGFYVIVNYFIDIINEWKTQWNAILINSLKDATINIEFTVRPSPGAYALTQDDNSVVFLFLSSS